LSVVVDAVKDVIDWVAGALKDVAEFVVDEIVEPVVEFVGDTVQAFFDNPVEAIAKVVAVSTGNGWAIPLIDGASAAANGGDLGDVLKSVATSYVAGKVGGEVAQHTAPFVEEFVGDALSAGLKEVAVASITKGTVAATTAIIYGEDPLEAFARGGIQAAVSAGMGKIAEQVGFDIEVTDPKTGKVTTQPLPNVVQNVVSAALAAELSGGDVNSELLANAVTRGLITTDLVKKYVGDNPNIGDRQLTYMTAAFQRTAAVALSGGTGAEAAAQIMAVISAYGTEELHDKINDSGVGDFINDILDKVSGDYAKVQEVREKLDGVGSRVSENYAEYEEKKNALETAWNAVTEGQDAVAELEADLNNRLITPEARDVVNDLIMQKGAEVQEALLEYNRLIDEGYLVDVNELASLINADNELLTEYKDDLIEAQNDLQRDADRLDGELTSIYAATDEYLVGAMDPGFNADEYRTLNNLSDDVDAYAHFLSEGQHSGAFTSQKQYDIATGNARDLVMNEIMFGEFGIGENSSAWSLTNADRQALQTILETQGYTSPESLNELLTGVGQDENYEKRKALFDEWVEAIGSTEERIFNTGDVLTQENVNILSRLGYDTSERLGTPMTAEEAVALDADLRNSEVAQTVEFAEGVTAEDVINGMAFLRTGDDGALKWTVITEETRWDPEHGWVTRRIEGNTWDEYNQDGELIPRDGARIIIAGGVQDVSDAQQVGLAFNAANSGTSWSDIQEGLGWSDALIDMAQNLMDKVSDSPEAEGVFFSTEGVTNFVANAMKAGGGILEAFNGMSTLFGIAPDDTALGKFAQQLQAIGTAGNTEEYKAELAKLQTLMNVESDLPEDAAWYERAFDKVATIAGAASEHPTMFLAEYIGVEALQELVPLAVGGVATLGAKGAAIAMGRTLSTRMAAGTGLSAAAITDLAESYGGTASETYDRAYMVALDSINPSTGQLYTESEAEEYAMRLAVQTGTVAATATALSLGVGGMALEKALLGSDNATGFLGKGLDELSSRIVNGVTITLKEGVTESIEEGIATAFREGHLNQIDPSIDVSGEVAGAAFMGFLVGGPVSGGAYGVSQVGDIYSNLISAVDPTVRAALDNVQNAFENYQMTDADFAAQVGFEEYLEMQRELADQEINRALDNLGVTDSVIRTNVLSQANPDQYVNTAQATTSFLNANPEYVATQEEINSFVQAGSYADVNEQIDRYVDDRYVDTQEVIDQFAEQGITLTEEEAQEYVGQGPEGHEAAVFEQLELQFDEGDTSEDEARAMFDALGYTPTEEEVADYVGRIDEATQKSVIAEYVDPRQVTEAEAQQFFDNLGYEATNDEIANFVGQNDNAEYQSQQQDFVDQYVDPRQVTLDELQAIADEENLTLTDDNYEEFVEAYVGQGGEDFEATNFADARSEYDASATTSDEVRQFFDDLGYTYTEEEVDQFANDSMTEEDQQSALSAYVDPRQFTFEESRQYLIDQGYTDPTDEEINRFVGQGDDAFQDTAQETAYTYIDELTATDDEDLVDVVEGVIDDPVTDDEVVVDEPVTDDEVVVDEPVTDDETVVDEPVTDDKDVVDVVEDVIDDSVTDDEAVVDEPVADDSDAVYDAIDDAVEAIGTDIDSIEADILEKMAEYEADGLARDDALAEAISDISDQLGQTETDILDALTETETNILTELGTTEADILDALSEIETTLTSDIESVEEDVADLTGVIGLPGIDDDPSTTDIDESQDPTGLFAAIASYEEAGMARDEAIREAVSELSTALGVTEETLLNRITEAETTLTDDIEAISNLVGKPATEVTQTDVDFVIDLIAGQQVIDENQQDLLAQYDVTGDGQITIEDQTLLEQLLAGENVFDQVADTSIYAPTGIFSEISQNAANQAESILQMEQNILTNIEQEALRARQQDFLQAALQAPDAMGQQVTVKTPDPLNLDYIYDFSSIFATPQQAAMFPSPYAKGGQVENTTDKLLDIIGD